MLMRLSHNGRCDPFTDFVPLVRNFFEPADTSSIWAPPTDIVESETAVQIVADLPGVKQEEIELKVEKGSLTLKAERKAPEKAENACACTERPYGVFERSFTLGDRLDVEKISASYEAGVLRVTVPKKPEAQSRRIEVKVS
ncbi:MAG: Hsp20/alpha crystallin family protein [Deltaproteobacteria bacterium]|nr:Hsp20/alpha crystallin family protein [Deltaproteobacteria bacterium]